MRRAWAALLAAAALAAVPAFAKSVAFVADVRGSATIEGNGPLAFLAELPEGTRVQLGTGATASVAFATSGAEFSLAGPGVFLVRSDEVVAEQGTAPKRRVVAVLSDTSVVARAAQAATASLRMRGLPPPSVPAMLEYPVGTRVSTLRPQLRWRPVPGEEYTVALQDAAGRELWKGRGRPEGTRPDLRLAAGNRYSWTVANSGGAVAEAQFETLPEDAIRRVDKSRAGARTFADRVVHALLLQELGAEHESREAWSALARERPEMPELPILAR
jgi:hypothetical protein